jgi:hypothetical protein
VRITLSLSGVTALLRVVVEVGCHLLLTNFAFGMDPYYIFNSSCEYVLHSVKCRTLAVRSYTGLFINNLTLSKFYCKKTMMQLGNVVYYRM